MSPSFTRTAEDCWRRWLAVTFKLLITLRVEINNHVKLMVFSHCILNLSKCVFWLVYQQVSGEEEKMLTSRRNMKNMCLSWSNFNWTVCKIRRKFYCSFTSHRKRIVRKIFTFLHRIEKSWDFCLYFSCAGKIRLLKYFCKLVYTVIFTLCQMKGLARTQESQIKL